MAIKERQVTLVDDNHIYKKVARVYEDYVATIGPGVHIFDTVVDTLINANVSQEEADAFPDMSDGRRQVAMERGLGLYED